jgi:hypothetical protein
MRRSKTLRMTSLQMRYGADYERMVGHTEVCLLESGPFAA